VSGPEANTCRSCGAAIIWIVTENGKRMPLDERVLTIITDAGKAVKGRQSHFSTCPQAANWRSPK
jgi:hypothetical protein